MLDRTVAPAAGKIDYVPLQEAAAKNLENGASLFSISAGVQPVFKLEIYLSSGIWYEPKPMVSWFTSKLLLEGTRTKSALEISQAFDALGAFVEINPGFDDVSIVVHGINRTFPEVLALTNEILTKSTFPLSSLETLKANRKDQIRVNNTKSDVLASKKIREALFGLGYPYGTAQQEGDVDLIEREDLLNYHAGALLSDPKVYISGLLEDGMMEQLNTVVASWDTKAVDERSVSPDVQDRHIYIQKENSLQSALRLAWAIPEKGTKDYFDYQLANTLLGGYFGSRLMKNIREDKGYTYGISSYPVHLKHQSFGVISTEVKAESTQDTLDEIRKEIDLLALEGPSVQELETVSNYLAGSFLSSIDTPFQLIKRFKSINDFGLGYDYYERYFESLKSIDPERIKEVTQKYFSEADMHSAIVGQL